jgi:hypothetical protein
MRQTEPAGGECLQLCVQEMTAVRVAVLLTENSNLPKDLNVYFVCLLLRPAFLLP